MDIWNPKEILSAIGQIFAGTFRRGHPSSSPISTPSVTDKLIDKWFPNAAREGCWITSCIDGGYNCIAWAAGDCNILWWPLNAAGVYWPPGLPHDLTLSNFIAAFKTVGYEEWKKENGRLESGYEKVAIFTDSSGEPTHAARQLPNGRWASKVGKDWKDVEHATEFTVEGTDYGKVKKYLRRKRWPLPSCPPSQCQTGNVKTCMAKDGPCPP